jgi:hypothetical protein
VNSRGFDIHQRMTKVTRLPIDHDPNLVFGGAGGGACDVMLSSSASFATCTSRGAGNVLGKREFITSAAAVVVFKLRRSKFIRAFSGPRRRIPPQERPLERCVCVCVSGGLKSRRGGAR